MRWIAISMLVALPIGCGEVDPTLEVKTNTQYWLEDCLRLYYTVPDGSVDDCAGVQFHQSGGDLFVTFLRAPLPQGQKVQAVPVPESDDPDQMNRGPFVEIPFDPAPLENDEGLTLHVNGKTSGPIHRGEKTR